MSIHKIEPLRRVPWIGDYNTLVDAINSIIDKLNAKIEVAEVTIDRQIKDFSFFKWEEVILPYNISYTLSSVADASDIFAKYTLTFKEMDKVNKLIAEWKVVSLIINVTEEVTEKEKKQEAVFEIVESTPIQDIEIEKPKQKKKRWRPKKTKRE